MISILIGVILFVTGLPLPSAMAKAIDSFGGMIAPACMLVIGIAISDCHIRDVLKFRNFMLCLIRQIVMPLLILLLIKFTNMSGLIEDGKSILLIVYMATASSTAATIANIAQKYEKSPEAASMINVLGVFLLLVTLPVMVTIYQLVV